MSRVGQNHKYTVYIRYFWLGNHQIYGHIRCIYTVLANSRNVVYTYITLTRNSYFCCKWLSLPFSCQEGFQWEHI